jgi:5'-nucleotidase
MISIPLLHFNDAYRVRPQKLSSKSPSPIDVTQFAQMVSDVRESWKESSKEGLVLFSGDLFAPSVESSVTRGTHMVLLRFCFVDRLDPLKIL